MPRDFPFDDPPNVATITTVNVLERGYPILFVSHDADDGGWQFLCDTTTNPDDGRVVGLDCIVSLDATVAEIAELPYGWCATRDRIGAPWKRFPAPPDADDDEMLLAAQHATCARFEAAFVPVDPQQKLGIARNVVPGAAPLHALRHLPAGGTCGWYIWAGELSEDPEFFRTVHVEHLVEMCPAILPYLGLAAGWRVLLAPGYEDVWYDASVVSPNVQERSFER